MGSDQNVSFFDQIHIFTAPQNGRLSGNVDIKDFSDWREGGCGAAVSVHNMLDTAYDNGMNRRVVMHRSTGQNVSL